MNLISMIKKSADHTSMKHYRSNPIQTTRLFGKEESYSKPFAFAVGKPTPSIMQQAFMDAVVTA